MAAYGYHQRPALIGPSLLAADLSNLTSESIRVLDAGADYLHLDVMAVIRGWYSPGCPFTPHPGGGWIILWGPRGGVALLFGCPEGAPFFLFYSPGEFFKLI
jgi:hypothetical protein